jgi:hypothetical protein
MAIKPRAKSSFDDEISLLNIIQLFKAIFKRIIIFIIVGGILGCLFGKLANPKYDGYLLISPAKIDGVFLINPETTITQITNPYFFKEGNLACQSVFSTDESENYTLPNSFRASLTKDKNLIKLEMRGLSKEKINVCLNAMANNIIASQNIIYEPIFENKKNRLKFYEKKIESLYKIADQSIPNKKDSLEDIHSNGVLNFQISMLSNNLYKLEDQLSPEKIAKASYLPILFNQMKFPSPLSGLFLGIFLGGVLGFFISLYQYSKFKLRN